MTRHPVMLALALCVSAGTAFAQGRITNAKTETRAATQSPSKMRCSAASRVPVSPDSASRRPRIASGISLWWLTIATSHANRSRSAGSTGPG